MFGVLVSKLGRNKGKQDASCPITDTTVQYIYSVCCVCVSVPPLSFTPSYSDDKNCPSHDFEAALWAVINALIHVVVNHLLKDAVPKKEGGESERVKEKVA